MLTPSFLHDPQVDLQPLGGPAGEGDVFELPAKAREKLWSHAEGNHDVLDKVKKLRAAKKGKKEGNPKIQSLQRAGKAASGAKRRKTNQ